MGFASKSKDTVKLSQEKRNINFYTELAHEKIAGICASADYDLCMKQYSLLGDYLYVTNKLFEYMFDRLLIVASNFAKMARVVKRYNLGVVINQDPNIMRTLLSKLMNSTSEHQSIKRDLYNLSSKYYSLELGSSFEDLPPK